MTELSESRVVGIEIDGKPVTLFGFWAIVFPPDDEDDELVIRCVNGESAVVSRRMWNDPQMWDEFEAH